MLIHGQRRQNLYDLIVSRVHRVSAIGLRVALVRQWQDDLVLAYVVEAAREPQPGCAARAHEGARQRAHEHGDAAAVAAAPDPVSGRQGGPAAARGGAGDGVRERALSTHIRGSKSFTRAASRLGEPPEQVAGAAGGRSEEDEAVVDENLGLRFGDFRSSLQVLVVEGVATIEGPFLRTTLGAAGREQ